MNIDRVVVATNNNPEYYQFWPIFAKRWLSWGVVPTLIAISEDKLDFNEEIGEILYVYPVEGVSTAHQAQIVRLFAAASFEEDVCLISDIDMLSLNEGYFFTPAENCDENEFIVYSADAYMPGNPAYPAYPMCYLCSKGSNFKAIIDGNLHNFGARVKEWLGYGFGWYTDEKVFYKKLKEWKNKNRKITLLRRGFNTSNDPMIMGRIDRGNNCIYNEGLLDGGFYIDFHMPRPYEKHKEIIDEVFRRTVSEGNVNNTQ